MPASLIPQVRRQLAPDYPPGTDFGWLQQLTWKGPQRVSVKQVNHQTGVTDWRLAYRDSQKLQHETLLVRQGDAKPVLLIKMPGSPKYFALNGHSRMIVSERMGRPVQAIIGYAASNHGPWERHRSSSHTQDTAAAPADQIIDLAFPVGAGAYPFNAAQHPRGFHGRFGFKGGGMQAGAGPGMIGGAATAGGSRQQTTPNQGVPPPGKDAEDQQLMQQARGLHRQAAVLRHQAGVLVKQANALLHPAPKAKGPVNPAKSAAAKKAAATRKAKGQKAFQKSGKGKSTSKVSSANAAKAKMLLLNARILTTRANRLDVAANALQRQALV